jgi:hypothetical protein
MQSFKNHTRIYTELFINGNVCNFKHYSKHDTYVQIYPIKKFKRYELTGIDHILAELFQGDDITFRVHKLIR